MIKPLKLHWGSPGSYLLSIILTIVLWSVLWWGIDAFINKDAKSVETYFANIYTQTNVQTNKAFNKQTNEPDSINKAKTDFKLVTNKIDALSVPSSLEDLQNKYVALYRDFSEDEYWDLAKEFNEVQIEYQQSLENRNKLYTETLKYKLVTDDYVAANKKYQDAAKKEGELKTKLDKIDQKLGERFNSFEEQLDKLAIELIEATYYVETVNL